MNGVLGDPCRKRHKFLNVQYDCDYSTPVKTASFCEAQLDNRTDSISCQGANEVITIQSATWGRAKDAYCCPFKQDDNCLANQCSGSTDSTELIGSICNGQAGCSWDDSIADQIKDPCSDVFKYMSVEYNCAVPAPPQRQNDSGFSGDFNESGGDCYAAMMAAYEYYSNVLDVVKSSRSHGDTFIGYNGPLGNGRHANRMDMFKFNMKKWGNRLDDQNCECPLKYTSAISTAFDQNKPIGKPK